MRSGRSSRSTSTRCSCRRRCGAPTPSTSSASSSARPSPGASSPRFAARARSCIRRRATCSRSSASSASPGKRRSHGDRGFQAHRRVAAGRLIALAEASPIAAMLENAKGEVELANDAFGRLLGLEVAPQSLTGVPVEEALRGIDRKALERQPIVVDGEPGGALWTARDKTTGPETTKGAADLALIEKIGMERSVPMERLSASSIRAQQLEIDTSLVERFQRIRQSTMTAMAAIGDLIDFSKVSGGVVLKKAEFALRPALAELVARVVAETEEHGCRLRIKVEQDVADELEGDVERLLLVLKNLLDNTFAIVPGSEVTLQITPEYVTDSGIQLSFTVSAVGEAPVALASAESGMGVAVAKFMVAVLVCNLSVPSRF